MSAIFVRPIPFTVGTNTGWNAGFPVSNMNLDQPGLIARSTSGTASFTVTLTGGAQSIDTVALVGSTLNSAATVTVTAGTYTSPATVAYTGTKPSGVSTKTILKFAPVSTSTVTISISTSTVFDIQRLVIGKAVVTEGIDMEAEQSFEDQSIVYNGPGYIAVDEYPVLPTWKFKISGITDAQWRTDFYPLFLNAGTRRAVLFVPDFEQPTYYQSQAMFGRFTSVGRGQSRGYDFWAVEAQMTGLAP